MLHFCIVYLYLLPRFQDIVGTFCPVPTLHVHVRTVCHTSFLPCRWTSLFYGDHNVNEMRASQESLDTLVNRTDKVSGRAGNTSTSLFLCLSQPQVLHLKHYCWIIYYMKPRVDSVIDWRVVRDSVFDVCMRIDWHELSVCPSLPYAHMLGICYCINVKIMRMFILKYLQEESDERRPLTHSNSMQHQEKVSQ